MISFMARGVLDSFSAPSQYSLLHVEPKLLHCIYQDTDRREKLDLELLFWPTETVRGDIMSKDRIGFLKTTPGDFDVQSHPRLLPRSVSLFNLSQIVAAHILAASRILSLSPTDS